MTDMNRECLGEVLQHIFQGLLFHAGYLLFPVQIWATVASCSQKFSQILTDYMLL